jgi:hypothetical protein
MKITKKQIIKIIKEEYQRVLNENHGEHRCMDGSMVQSDSGECYDDILNRIEDAEYNRGSHSCGTEDRIYYNGLLKGLRNKRNRLKKSLAPAPVVTLEK